MIRFFVSQFVLSILLFNPGESEQLASRSTLGLTILSKIAKTVIESEDKPDVPKKLCEPLCQATRELKEGAGDKLGVTITEPDENDKFELSKVVEYYEKGLLIIISQIDKQKEIVEGFSLDRPKAELEEIVLPSIKAEEDTARFVQLSLVKAQKILAEQVNSELLGVPLGRVLVPAISEIEKVRQHALAWRDASIIRRSEVLFCIAEQPACPTGKYAISASRNRSGHSKQTPPSSSPPSSDEFSDELKDALRRKQEMEDAKAEEVSAAEAARSAGKKQEQTSARKERLDRAREQTETQQSRISERHEKEALRAKTTGDDLRNRIEAARNKVSEAEEGNQVYSLKDFLMAESSTREKQNTGDESVKSETKRKLDRNSSSYQIDFDTTSAPSGMREDMIQSLDIGFKNIRRTPEFRSNAVGFSYRLDGITEEERRELDMSLNQAFGQALQKYGKIETRGSKD